MPRAAASRARPPPAARRLPDATTLDALRDDFLRLHAITDPRVRDQGFQRLLNDLFTCSGLTVGSRFTLRGGQVTCTFEQHGTRYAVVARWPRIAQPSDLGQPSRRAAGSRADPMRIIVNVAGFGPDALEAGTAAGSFVALDGVHLLAVLERRIGLDDLLERLIRHLKLTGMPYLPISQALT